jgi:hypothetical protein
VRANSGPTSLLAPAIRRSLRWLLLPLWIVQLATGAKSFSDNPLLGSRILNRLGLHVWRLKAAHAVARSRRARLASLIPTTLRAEFDRNGFITVENFLPPEEFASLQIALMHSKLPTRTHQQGDTITRRVSIGPEMLGRFPALAAMLDSPRWTGLMAYVAATRSKPLYYLQTILGGIAEGPADPQLDLHADTFHPSLKAWYFLTDVPEDGRPLTYVAGSHRLSAERLAWEKRRSMEVLANGDLLSRRGSLRISAGELHELRLPQPTVFAVPANTLVVADTCGFHARADSHRPTTRVELWAYCRRTPFVPWAAGGLLSWAPIADRRGGWLAVILDCLDRRGLKKQHWTPEGLRRATDPEINPTAEVAPAQIQDRSLPSSRAA